MDSDFIAWYCLMDWLIAGCWVAPVHYNGLGNKRKKNQTRYGNLSGLIYIANFILYISPVHYIPLLYIIHLSFILYTSPLYYIPLLYIIYLSFILYTSPLHYTPLLYIICLSIVLYTSPLHNIPLLYKL